MDSNFKDAVTKLNTPFDVYKLDCNNIFNSSDAFKLQSALLKMNFKKKSCDLYSFGQSPDFFKIKKNQKPQVLNDFLDNILITIKQNISEYLGKPFNNVISVSCSKYDHGDYLLCHDDRVDDRSVAFIYYLNYDWLTEWGGTLDIYSADEKCNAKEIVQSILPEFNTMIFFPVGNNSYHQVAENVSDFSRISINGWFHCDNLSWNISEPSPEKTISTYLPLRISPFQSSSAAACFTAIYRDSLFREAIKETFHISGGYIMCDGFLKPLMVELLSNELFANDLKWKLKGPVNKRLHKYLDINNLPYRLLFIVNMLKTDYMFQFIKDCTGFNVLAVSLEVQRWHGGHYMVSGGNDSLSHANVVNLYIFFSQSFGAMHEENNEDLHYVFQDKLSLEPKFACRPMDNSFFMVHRNTNIDSYVKYCKKVDGHAWTVIVASYLIINDCDVCLERL